MAQVPAVCEDRGLVEDETERATGVGWRLDPRERGDFYHRIRVFPPEVAAWRERMVDHVIARPDLFRGVRRDATRREIRARIDDGISYLREVARIAALLHGTPLLGNKSDPVDELVYIILARKTREVAYQAAFIALKKEFARWDDLLDAPRDRVTRLVHSGGLSGKKTVSLFGVLGRLRERFGTCTLDPARTWPDEELESFLCSLPEISRKSAYCIMMCALGRRVFPVDTHVGRVLSRLGPYGELGLHLEGLGHKQLQAVLADLVPPNLRHSLHVNLVAHGRAICRSQRPLCDRCELRNLCSAFRKAETRRIQRAHAPTVVDLFAGAGGLSEGFRRAGYKILLALDSDPVALRTYALNHPGVPRERIVCRDIRDVGPGELRRLVGRTPVDVLVGAPPCQGFSHAGFRSKRALTGHRVASDTRNYLYEYMVTAALELRPRVFLMENVPGMNSARRENLSFLEAAAARLRNDGGFSTAIWRLNAAAVGVPQERIRYFLVAWRTRRTPLPPHEEYRDIQRPDFDVDALPPVGLDDAIFDLPPRRAGEGTAVDRRERTPDRRDPRYRRYLVKHGLIRESPILYNHYVRYHNERDLELYGMLEPGEDSIHAVERYRRKDLMRYRLDVFEDKYYKLRNDWPSKTIVAHLAKDGNAYVHPSQDRSLTVREAARVQSFDDGYAFCGAPSDQWVQLGNAVPPVLARAIATALRPVLESRTRR